MKTGSQGLSQGNNQILSILLYSMNAQKQKLLIQILLHYD